jgi:transposase
MAMTIVEVTRSVVGGIDTHGEVHVAAALDGIGGLLGSESFGANPAGYEALLTWLESFGTLTKVGVEGTGSYGAGIARHIARAGVVVIEIDRPGRTCAASRPSRPPRARSRVTGSTEAETAKRTGPCGTS